MRRAKNFVRQLDVIIDFVSSIIANVKELSETMDAGEDKLSDYELEEYHELGDDVFFKRDKTYLKYVNPLQLVDKDGNEAPNNSVANLKKEGYLFDVILQKVIFSGFKLEQMSEDSPDGLKTRAFRGVKNYREEVAAIIPMSDDFIMVDFEYNYIHNRELQESMLFKKGQLDNAINFPPEIKNIFKDLARD